MWDEVLAVFDRDARPAEIVVRGGARSIRLTGPPDKEAFLARVRPGLLRARTRGLLLRRRTRERERTRIEDASYDDLWAELLRDF